MENKLDVTTIKEYYTYPAYRELIKDLLKEQKSTSEDTDETKYEFSVLNDKRMDRLDKTIKLADNTIEKLKELPNKQTWVLIAEGWCGDAAQNAPIIAKMSEVTPNIELKIVIRDKNLDLIDKFLTNGARAIPKLVIVENDIVINTWGARPSIATQMVIDYKKEHGKVDAELKKNLQIWYNKNKGVNLQDDILSLLV